MGIDQAGFVPYPPSYQPAGQGSLETLELRPSRRKVRRNLIVAAVVFGAMVAGASASGGLTAFLITSILAVAVVALLLLHVRFSRIVVTAAEIRVSGLFYRRVRPRGHGARIVRATLVPPRGPSVDNVFVLDPHGKVLIRINGSLQDPEELDRLVAHLGLPATGPGHPVTAAQLARVHPGIVPLIERRPYLFGFAFAGIIIVIVIIAAMIIATMTSL